MAGYSRMDGSPLDLYADIRQSIADILTTPRGRRSHRERYGSNIPRMIDAPMTAALRLMLVAEIAEALSGLVKGEIVEPRFILRRVDIDAPAPGRITARITGEVKETPAAPAELVTIDDIPLTGEGA